MKYDDDDDVDADDDDDDNGGVFRDGIWCKTMRIHMGMRMHAYDTIPRRVPFI